MEVKNFTSSKPKEFLIIFKVPLKINIQREIELINNFLEIGGKIFQKLWIDNVEAGL